MSDDPNAQSTAAVVSSHNTAAGSLPRRAFEQGSKEREIERESRRVAALPNHRSAPIYVCAPGSEVLDDAATARWPATARKPRFSTVGRRENGPRKWLHHICWRCCSCCCCFVQLQKSGQHKRWKKCLEFVDYVTDRQKEPAGQLWTHSKHRMIANNIKKYNRKFFYSNKKIYYQTSTSSK